MKEEIKKLRLEIDGYYQLTVGLKPLGDEKKEGIGIIEQMIRTNSNSSKQIEDCCQSLLYAKAWLGKLLGEMGEGTPYAKDGNRKTINDIESATEKAVTTSTGTSYINDGVLTDNSWTNKNHIEKVDWLRQKISIVHMECTSKFNQIINGTNPQYHAYSDLSEIRSHVKQHLAEARFALGFELERVKNEVT